MSRELVASVIAKYPNGVVAKDPEFDNLRRRVLPHIIDILPGGSTRWGVLRKTGSIASDIVVDKNNLDHYDVFSGFQNPDGSWTLTPAWKNYGHIRNGSPNWRWMSVEESGIVPLPFGVEEPEPKPDEPGTNPDISALWARVRKVEERVDKHIKD